MRYVYLVSSFEGQKLKAYGTACIWPSAARDLGFWNRFSSSRARGLGFTTRR